MKWKLRSLKDDSYGIVHLPRLLALTIPFMFVIFLHIANVFTPVPDYLMEPVIQIAILFTGAIIAVLGLTVGVLAPILLVIVIWGICIYYYANFIAGWI